MTLTEQEAFWNWAEKTHVCVVNNLRKGYNGHLKRTKKQEEE